MLKNIALLLFLILISAPGLAQTFSVKGSVINSVTKETIPICNVYFSGSTIGTMTDMDGNFEIKNVKPGAYVLVVSHISYDFQSFAVEITNQDLEIGVVRLKEKKIESSFAEVKDKIDRKWRRQFNRFKNYILGKHYRERDIEIPNAYEAEFIEVRRTLIKKHPFTLEIRNSYTGYTIYYSVQEFLLGSGTEQFMIGFPRFEKMEPEDDNQMKDWGKNRATAYNGSLRHFLYSLINNQFEEDNFKVEITNMSPLDYNTDKSVKKMYEKPLIPEKMTDKFLIEDTDDDHIKKISLKDFLKVTYFGEASYDGKSLTTFIEAPEGHFYVFSNGIIVDPTSIIFYGYLASEGLYEMLPFDYELPEQTK